MTMFDLLPAPDPDLPCCMASAVTAGRDCTCWVPVLDLDLSDQLQHGPMNARRKACTDCAYRAGSPERQDDDGAIPDYGRTSPFVCHQGMAKVARWVHPTGAVIVPDGDDYQPRQMSGCVWTADGRPAEYCAGWAAVNRIRS